MSKIVMQATDFDDDINWIEKAVEKKYIKYYDHSEFTHTKPMDESSSVGSIFRANWKDTDTLLVVKTPSKLTVKEIINELKMQLEVDFHANILRFYGVSKADLQYSLVLEYADGGSLYSYLKENIKNLEWDDKYRLAFQLASAIECIHNKNIIHSDLHAQNVLVHKNTIKLADFGLSKKSNEVSDNSNDVFGLLPYIDPKYLNNVCIKDGSRKFYLVNFKSDIYSIGVLFWQISSGSRPFEDSQYDASLAFHIMEGNREEIIKGTPLEYSNLYTACWSDNPDERPPIQKVVLCLKSIISQEVDEEINSIISTKSDVEKESSNEDFDYTDDFDDLVIGDDDCQISLTEVDSDLIASDSIQDDMIEPIQDDDLIKERLDSTDNIQTIIDELIELSIKIQDEIG
ncbi:unnamed protein product [Rhizophagus irregularis]|nr:unnamed protein product [Rhizophagus irregularis]